MASSVREVWDYRALVANMTRRQLKSEHKRDFLGAAWSLLNPLLNLAILSLVFGTILQFGDRISGDGINSSGRDVFALFLFAALIPFGQWRRTASGSIMALRGSADLLHKVYFPPDVSLIAYTMVQLRQALFEGAIMVAILFALGEVSWTILFWPLLLPLVAMFALGTGYVLALLAAYYADTEYLVEHFMQLLFYLTPIIYSLDSFGDDVTIAGIPVKTMLELNPLTSYVGVSRSLLYYQVPPDPTELAVVVILSPVTLAFGFYLFRTLGRDITEEL